MAPGYDPGGSGDAAGMIVFACDGTAATGLGHVGRCLALAQAFQDLGWPVRLWGAFDAAAQGALSAAQVPFEVHGGGVAGSPPSAIAARLGSPALLLVDSYSVDGRWLEAARRDLGAPVVYFDDFHALDAYPCDAVINAALRALPGDYGPGPELLLGPGCMVFSRAHRALRAGARPRDGRVRRVAICVGGVDLHGLTLRALQALPRRADLEVVVVLGQPDGSEEGLRAALGAWPRGELRLREASLAAIFHAADVCITGGGRTKYEAAYLGAPALVLSQNAGQALDSRDFAARGLCVDLGLGPELDDAQLGARLRAALGDAALLARTSLAGLGAFPAACTERLAEALASRFLGVHHV